MRKKERQRYHLFEKVIEGVITLKEASELMEVSYRQAKRSKKSFEEGDAKGLLHGNKGRRSGNKLSEEIIEKILCLSKEQYSDFNDVHFKEKIEESRIKVSLSTVQTIRRNNGIEAKRKRRTKKYFGRRERKS